MLHTACFSLFDKIEKKMKPYYVIKNHGNDVVVPDLLDLAQYRNGVMSWEGLRVNYLARLMRPEAEEWMRNVCAVAVTDDVALVSDEESGEKCYRILLAEMMMNMFSGRMKLYYAGELKES